MTSEKEENASPQMNSVESSQEEPELVAAGPDARNWKGIGIAFIVIICVCALIVTAVVLLTPARTSSNVLKTRISLYDYINDDFDFTRFNGTWISDNEFTYPDSLYNINIYDVNSNVSHVIMPNHTFIRHEVRIYSLSADRQYMLLISHIQKVYRHSFKATYSLYNILSGDVTPLFPDSPDLKLQYAEWGPTGNQLVYVLNENVYYMASVKAKPQQLTSDGAADLIFNGIPDWVYEEEIISTNNAIWFSDDGKKLCFATFNDTEVDDMMFSYYGSFTDLKNVYPNIIKLKYPKPGRNNPKISFRVVNLNEPNVLHKVQPPKEYEGLDYYFTQAQWMNNDTLAIIWLKRAQNSSLITFCKESNNWQCVKNYQQDSNRVGWVEFYGSLIFTKDQKYYFVILPGRSEDGGAGSFPHIHMLDTKTGEKQIITHGKYEVVNIYSYDSERDILYYGATLENKPGERHIFGISNVTLPIRKTFCLTCYISKNCLFNKARFSTDSQYYVYECLGPGIPMTQVRKSFTAQLELELDENERLQEYVNGKLMPTVKTLDVPLDGDYVAKVKLLLPPGLREDEITKYPALLQVYAGPKSQQVNEHFSVAWGHYLASSQNIIHISADVRGSGYQGNKFLFEIYRRLGTVEVDDQISVVSYLIKKFPYIDETKVAVFGWSYGGYMAAKILSSNDGQNDFKCGISVAPVTNWLYYDSVYTERYMQSPSEDDNLKSYEESSVLKNAAAFQKKKFLLVHGTADDNVHWQQSALLTKALVQKGVVFQIQIYPDEQHTLSGVKLHLYLTLGKFLKNCYDDKDKT